MSVRQAASIIPLATVVVIGACYAIQPLSVPETSGYVFDLERLRELAGGSGGPLPLRARVLVIAESTKPMAGVLGGVRFDDYVMIWTAFQVVYGDRFIVIDAPGDRDLHQARSPADAFYPERYESLQRALRRAEMIIVTHEHPDHIGGVVRSPHLNSIRSRVFLTREQAENRRELERAGAAAGASEWFSSLQYDEHHVVAPGLVLVKAPGHTPGSQMIYLRTENGSELLFVGDIAWHRDQIRAPKARPRISSWLMGEDIDRVGSQLRTLHNIVRVEGLHLVISHDAQELEAHLEAGRLHAGFE